jgi:hypothetical protein
MKTLKASEEFVVGKNSIGWVGVNFKERFYDMEFLPKETELEVRTLEKPMTDKEIIKAWHLEPIELGELLNYLKTADQSKWYLCHIKDSDGVLWAVYGLWGVGGWVFGADPLDDPSGWCAGRQFLSRGFSDTLSSESSDTLSLENLEKRVAKLEEVIKSHN